MELDILSPSEFSLPIRTVTLRMKFAGKEIGLPQALRIVNVDIGIHPLAVLRIVSLTVGQLIFLQMVFANQQVDCDSLVEVQARTLDVCAAITKSSLTPAGASIGQQKTQGSPSLLPVMDTTLEVIAISTTGLAVTTAMILLTHVIEQHGREAVQNLTVAHVGSTLEEGE